MIREKAIVTVNEYVKTDSLLKHLLAVETVMRSYARKFRGVEDVWGSAGLLHDFDWEVCPTPEDHPTFGAEILRDRGFSEEIIRAVLSHGNHTGIERVSLLEKTLFAVDELSGFIRAVALVRPDKSLDNLLPKSIKKKMKDKSFAKEVSREDITNGATELGVELDDHITFIINSLKPIADKLGLSHQ